jgi:hypothetical protein
MLANSDLMRVRDDMAYFHRMANAKAEREGGSAYFKTEYVMAWTAFRDDPNTQTASALLNVAPQLLPYFKGHSGGSA